MSDLLELVDSLELKLNKVVSKLHEAEAKTIRLQRELDEKQREQEEQLQLLSSWKERYNTLKLTNSMLGSEDFKRETKLKINALIKEIDHCIVQLSK